MIISRYPDLIHLKRFCDNGLSPDASFYSRVGVGLNHLTAYRRKPLFQRTLKLGASGGTTGVAWRFYCCTGYGAKRIGVKAVLGLDDRSIAVDPYITTTITAVGGAALTPAASFHYGASSVIATDAPEEFQTSTQYMTCASNTTYSGAIEFFDNVRVVSLLVFEDFLTTVDDATDYFSTYSPVGNSPIFDSRIGRQLQGIGGIIRRNGALRADWVPWDGTAVTRASATLANLLDTSVTGTPSSSSPGVTLCTSYKNTVGATTVPITMAVYGSIPAGSGTVRFRDTSGNDAATVTVNNATPQWFTATGALTVGAAQKYDLMLNGDGANAISVRAVSIYEGE